MSTYMAKAGQVDRKWYVIDAAGKPLGRVAAQAAVLLRGKHKPTFTPHVDCGDHVIIINCAEAVLTAVRLKRSIIIITRVISATSRLSVMTPLMRTKPEKGDGACCSRHDPLEHHRQSCKARLRVYAGSEHKHEAQKPTAWEL